MKRWICFALALCVTLCLPGCGGQPAAPQTAPAQKPVTLTFMLPQSHYKDFLRQAIEQFETEYPNIRIDPQIIPDNQWIDLVKRKIAVGETPDIIRIDRGLIIDVGTRHFVEFGPQEPWYARVLPEQLGSKRIDGKLYGLPIGANSAVIIAYNAALFREYGVKVPRSMGELRAACAVFQAGGVIPLYASDKDSWTAGLGFTAAAPQAVPTQVWDSLVAGQLHWNEVPEFAQILREFAAFRQQGFTNANYLEATYASAVSSMAAGNTAMYITGQFFINDVLTQNPQIELMATAVPYTQGVLTTIPGPGQFSVFQSSPYQEEAKCFLNWFSQPDNMDVFNAGWGHTAVFSDQKLELPAWQRALQEEYISKGKTVPQMDSILSGVDLNEFWGCQQEMLAGFLTPEQVLEQWDTLFFQQLSEKDKA